MSIVTAAMRLLIEPPLTDRGRLFHGRGVDDIKCDPAAAGGAGKALAATGICAPTRLAAAGRLSRRSPMVAASTTGLR